MLNLFPCSPELLLFDTILNQPLISLNLFHVFYIVNKMLVCKICKSYHSVFI